MPLLNIQTNCKLTDEQANQFILDASKRVAQLLTKTEGYVMVQYHFCSSMCFAGTLEPLAYLELKSIGLPIQETQCLSEALCDWVGGTLDIKVDRIYIEFSDVSRAMWGWNKGTFERG